MPVKYGTSNWIKIDESDEAAWTAEQIKERCRNRIWEGKRQLEGEGSEATQPIGSHRKNASLRLPSSRLARTASS